MSCNACPCSAEANYNTGVPQSQEIWRNAVKGWIVPRIANDGTRNAISQNDTLDKAYFDDKMQNPDPSKRWYPIGELVNVTQERADQVTETYDTGNSANIIEGVRTFIGWLLEYAPVYKRNLDKIACKDFGIISIDECNNLAVIECANGVSAGVDQYRPLPVFRQSFRALPIPKSRTEEAKIQISFEFDNQLLNDADIRIIPRREIPSEKAPLEYEGLKDVKSTISAETTSGFTAEIVENFDSTLTDRRIEGLVIANFEVFNETTNLPVTVTGAAEAPLGFYAITFAAQPSATDVVRYRVVGEDYSEEQTFDLTA